MPPETIQFSPRLRNTFHVVFGLLFLSGAAWWALHRWGQVDGEFGPQPHPLEPWLIRVHGGAALAVLVLLGLLLPVHVRRAWLVARNRVSGSVMLALCLLLALTGWALYYAGGETIRTVASRVHVVLGLALPFLLLMHVALGRRSRPPDDTSA
jgi:hypothetical protein